jgi:hypothetical protein
VNRAERNAGPARFDSHGVPDLSCPGCGFSGWFLPDGAVPMVAICDGCGAVYPFVRIFGGLS